MPLFRALAKNMAASYFGKKAPYGFVMEVTLLYVFILWYGRNIVNEKYSTCCKSLEQNYVYKQAILIYLISYTA
jgi:hypothetical protein